MWKPCRGLLIDASRIWTLRLFALEVLSCLWQLKLGRALQVARSLAPPWALGLCAFVFDKHPIGAPVPRVVPACCAASGGGLRGVLGGGDGSGRS